CRQAGWADVVLRKGYPTESRLRPVRLRRDLEVVPDETPSRLAAWNALCHRLHATDYIAEYATESRPAAGPRNWSYESRSLLRRLETRLFHFGLIPLGSEGT